MSKDVHNLYTRNYASVTNMLTDLHYLIVGITMFKIIHHLLDIPTENLVFHPSIHYVEITIQHKKSIFILSICNPDLE